jgi:23S rRNA (guanosine2251-2'-O)-methyltransferase
MKEKHDIVYGIQAIKETVNAGKTIEKVLLKKEVNSEALRELQHILRNAGITVQYVPYEKLNSVTRKNHQGAIAYISAIEYANPDFLIPQLFEEGETPLFIMLDGVTDVRNFGSICRTAECAGAHGIIVPRRNSVLITSDAMKTSAGALNYLPVIRSNNLEVTIETLRNSGFQIIAATEKGEKNYFEVEYNVPTLIIMGAEDTGISNDILKISDELVKIPINGKVESLNVSNASSIIIYEAMRQRSLD